jgi:hypothetical protein
MSLQFSLEVVNSNIRKRRNRYFRLAKVVMNCTIYIVKSKAPLFFLPQLFFYLLQHTAIATTLRIEFDEFIPALLEYGRVEVLIS